MNGMFLRADTIDKKTCNKIKKWASKKWEVSAVDTAKSY